MSREELQNHKPSEVNIKDLVKDVMKDDDSSIVKEDAGYLHKDILSSNDTIEKILVFRMYKILDLILEPSIISKSEQGHIEEINLF